MKRDNERNRLPDGWEKKKFAEIIEFLTDFQANGSFAGIKGNVKYYSEENFAVLVRLKDLRHELKDVNSLIYTDEKGYNFLKKSRIAEGDLLVANVGAGVGTTLKMPKFNKKATLAPNMFRVDLKSDIVKQYFLAFSNSIDYWSQLKLVSTGSGQPKINKSQYKSIEIPVPSRDVQLSIVSKIEELFSELDKGKEQLEIARRQLKTYRQSLLKWAFEGRLTKEDVKEGELPKEWEWSTLNELKKFSLYGPRFSSNDYSETGVAVLRTTDISERGKVDWINSPKLNISDKEYEKYKLIKNDLLITRTGSIGRLSIFNDDKKAIPGAFLIHYRLTENLNIWYIFYFLKSQIAQRHFIKMSAGVGRPNLNVPNIELLQIPIAPSEEQDNIVQVIESHLSACDKLEESINHGLRQAESLRQSILKKAFEGKLVS